MDVMRSFSVFMLTWFTTILADRVQCPHGSATSSISPEEIFYLLSRGIPEHTARRMIAQGFLKHALDQFSDETLRAAVEEIVLS